MTTLSLPDMSCGHCKATVEKTVKALDPQATLDFDMDARTVGIEAKASPAAISEALTAAGYPPA